MFYSVHPTMILQWAAGRCRPLGILISSSTLLPLLSLSLSLSVHRSLLPPLLFLPCVPARCFFSHAVISSVRRFIVQSLPSKNGVRPIINAGSNPRSSSPALSFWSNMGNCHHEELRMTFAEEALRMRTSASTSVGLRSPMVSCRGYAVLSTPSISRKITLRFPPARARR